jgi:hypothetical protein
MKKLSKEKQLKNRIAQMEENYNKLDRENDRLRGELRDYKEKEETERFQMKTYERADREYSDRLTGIIRWLINPETAKTPTEEELRKMGMLDSNLSPL